MAVPCVVLLSACASTGGASEDIGEGKEAGVPPRWTPPSAPSRLRCDKKRGMAAHRLLTGVFALVQENPPAGMLAWCVDSGANRGGMRREMRGSLEPSVPRSNRRCRQPPVVALREPIPTRIADPNADMPDSCWKLAKRDMLGDLVQESRSCGTGRVEANVCLSAARQSENVDLAPWD